MLNLMTKQLRIFKINKELITDPKHQYDWEWIFNNCVTAKIGS